MMEKLFVPGRLCLFGEHSDWAGGYRKVDKSIVPGYCIAVGTNQGIYANVMPHPDKFILRSRSLKGDLSAEQEFPMDEQSLFQAAKSGGFFCYSAGVAYCILKDYKVKGLIIDNEMDLPPKRGLSSSAAICVLTARAFSKIYGLGLTKAQEMEYAYKGEILTGSECGRMDQVCAYGGIPVFLTFDGDNMSVEEISPGKTIYMVIADLRSGKNTRKILADLNHHFMNENSPIKDKLRYALGESNKRILMEARKALESGDARRIGELMIDAQSIFDKYVLPACPEELTAPKLHRILSHPDIQELIWGGKGVGSQGDGCAQFIAKDMEAQDELVKRLSKLEVTPYKLNIEMTISRRQEDEKKDQSLHT